VGKTQDGTFGMLEAQGGPLYYEVEGEGHPLVLIHAGVADNTMWDEQLDTFARHYRVIRYDTRGFGKTPNTEKDFSNRQDLYDLLEHLSVERAYVMGVSRGGQIAIDFTLEHPEKVAALIPVASGMSGFDGQPTYAEMAIFTQMEEAWEKKEFDRLADLEVAFWADGPGQLEGRAAQDVRERVRAMCLSNYAVPESTGKPIVLDPPAAGRLNEIKVPTLVVVGDLDASGVLQVADVLEKEIQGAKKVVIPGTAHMLSMEQPERFSKIVLDFLAEL
jgi:pimeloyl-ACP methyl ester carboxylesterase